MAGVVVQRASGREVYHGLRDEGRGDSVGTGGVLLHSWTAPERSEGSTARTNRFMALTADLARPLLWLL